MASVVEWLPKLSGPSLMYLCDRHKVPDKGMSRQQMLDALLARFSDPEYVYKTVRGLSRPLRLTLLAYTLFNHQFSWSKGMQLDNLLLEPHKPYLTELEHLGFVSGVTVAVEPGEAAVRIWLEDVARETPPPKQVVLPDPNGPGALRDIFALVGMAWRRELPLTKNSLLFKKAEEELLRRMEGSPAIKGDGLKQLVLSYALARGLLAEATYDESGKTGFIATEHAWDWSNMSWGEIWSDMADFLLDSRNDGLGWIRELICALGALPSDAWLPHERLVDEYSSLAGPEADPGDLEALLVLMAGLDLLVIGIDAHKGYRFQPSGALLNLCSGEEPRMPGEEQKFLVDPTYSVTAPKTLPPEILCCLERWCGDRKADMVLTYKLSQASLRVALEEGDRPADVIRFFEERSTADLPQNVLFSIKEWTAGARKARFEHLMLLRVGDADTAHIITGDKILRKWVFDQITPTDLVIDASAVEKVRRRLGEIGVATAPGVRRPGDADSRPRIVWQSEVPHVVSASAFRLKWAGGDEED